MELPNGVTTVAVEDLRAQADRMMCAGQWQEGKLLRALLATAEQVGRVESLEKELEDVQKEARDTQRDLDYAQDTVKRVQDRLDTFKRSFMRVLDQLQDQGKLEGFAFDKLQEEFKDGLDDASGPLYDIA
jgi:chromosome segregation ATPase